jgi:undecaprenyl-diphosphatase
MDLSAAPSPAGAGETPGSGRARRGRAWAVAGALALGFLVLLWLDRYTLAFSETVGGWRWLQNVFNPLRELGNLVAEAMILGMAYALDPRRRRWVWAAAIAIAIASLATHGLKIAVGRLRPEARAGVLAFTPPWARFFEDRRKSFPSGHASAAFSLAAVLAHAYPRARSGFYLLATGCGMVRVADARHFPTDVYAGALLGIATAWWVIGLAEKRCAARPTGS